MPRLSPSTKVNHPEINEDISKDEAISLKKVKALKINFIN